MNLVLKVADNETAKYVSESLGKATIAHAQERATQTNLKNNTDYNIDVKQRDLMTMDEVKTLDNKSEIIIVSGEYPLVDIKHPYTTHKYYKYTSDAIHIQFDRSRLKIRPVVLTKESERPSAAPKVELLSVDRMVRLFQTDDDYGFSSEPDDLYGEPEWA